MWYKNLIVIFLFYIFALLQNSFFTHLNLFGATPNLVFILFFILVFFSTKNAAFLDLEIIFYAIAAGLFLDVFSRSYFGISIFSFLLISFLIKKIRSALQEKKNDKFPIIYFLSLFLASLIIYNLIFTASFSISSIASLIYNLLFACLAFYIYKKFFYSITNSHQLTLFTQ